MCNQRLDSVDELLAHIVINSGVNHHDVDLTFLSSDDENDRGGKGKKRELPDAVWDTMNETDFDLAFRHYLSEPGHPDVPVIQEMVGEEAFVRDAADPLLRARLFLAFLSGSDLKPIDPNWNIKVR